MLTDMGTILRQAKKEGYGAVSYTHLDVYKRQAFEIESSSDVQVTLEVEAGQEYKVFIDNTNVGMMKANLGGKLTLSVELSEGTAAAVRVKKQ